MTSTDRLLGVDVQAPTPANVSLSSWTSTVLIEVLRESAFSAEVTSLAFALPLQQIGRLVHCTDHGVCRIKNAPLDKSRGVDGFTCQPLLQKSLIGWPSAIISRRKNKLGSIDTAKNRTLPSAKAALKPPRCDMPRPASGLLTS